MPPSVTTALQGEAAVHEDGPSSVEATQRTEGVGLVTKLLDEIGGLEPVDCSVEDELDGFASLDHTVNSSTKNQMESLSRAIWSAHPIGRGRGRVGPVSHRQQPLSLEC